MTKENLTWHQFDIRLLSVSASLVLSAWAIINSSLPNDDAYVYMRTAEVFADQGLAAAYEHYPWASYSVLIGLFHGLGFEVLQAAYVLNTIFFAIITFAFVSLASEIRDDRLFVQLAALTVLIYPELNEFRVIVVRDIGFWATSLLAMMQFVRFAGNPTPRYAIGFCALQLLGASMRPEAIIYLFLMPFALLLVPALSPTHRRNAFVIMQVTSLIMVFALLILLLLLGINLPAMLSSQFQAYGIFLRTAFDLGTASNAAVITELFGSIGALNSGEWFWLFMLTGLSAVLVAEIAASIGLPCLLLLGWGLSRGFIGAQGTAARTLVATALVNILIAAGFIYVSRFLDSRYTMLLSISVMMLVPMVLRGMFTSTASRGNGARVAVGVVVLYLFIDAYVSFGRDKSFIYESTAWILNNAEQDAALLTNNRSVAYLSGMVEDYDELRRVISLQDVQGMRPGDLLALEIYFESDQLLQREETDSLLMRETSFPDNGLPRIEVYSRRAGN